jgi:hypothetical protein
LTCCDSEWSCFNNLRQSHKVSELKWELKRSFKYVLLCRSHRAESECMYNCIVRSFVRSVFSTYYILSFK